MYRCATYVFWFYTLRGLPYRSMLTFSFVCASVLLLNLTKPKSSLEYLNQMTAPNTPDYRQPAFDHYAVIVN